MLTKCRYFTYKTLIYCPQNGIMSYHFEDRDMTTKTYELVVKTNVDLSKIYKMIGGYITGHSQIKESCEGDYPYDQDDVMEQYSDDTKSSNLYYHWWHKNACFKGDYNDTPFALTAGVKSFHDSNFESIIFSGHETEAQVRERIKAQFFKKFNVIVDKLDNSTLIEEVKVRIDSDAFNEHYTRKYCYELLKEYEMYEKMFSGYVINKVEIDSDESLKNSITFYLNTPPDDEGILHNVIDRIEELIENYEQLMIALGMEDVYYFPKTIEDAIENHTNFKIIGVDLIEYVTESNTVHLL